jgi:hypothetical protein
MQRRGSSGESVKDQRAARPKARKTSTASTPKADLQEQLDQRTRELEEALEQQTATSEVLSIIRRSPAGHRYGFVFLRRYGRYVRLSEDRIMICQWLFRQYGGRVVFFWPLYRVFTNICGATRRGSQLSARRVFPLECKRWNCLGRVFWFRWLHVRSRN